MNRPTHTPRRLVRWIGSALRDLRACHPEVRRALGIDLLALQSGDTPDRARPFGEGVRRDIWKLVDDHEGNTFRLAYTLNFQGVVYVLDVFQKKSKSGRSTPLRDRQRVALRYRYAAEDYELWRLNPPHE